MTNKQKVHCDLCGAEILAHKTVSRTEYYCVNAAGDFTEKATLLNHPTRNTKDEPVITYHCSNPDCAQSIGDKEYFTSYARNTDPDEFRLFQQLDRLQDVLEEFCRMELETNSQNTAVVIRNTLAGFPEKLPLIIEMKRKRVEGDFLDKIDLSEVLREL